MKLTAYAGFAVLCVFPAIFLVEWFDMPWYVAAFASNMVMTHIWLCAIENPGETTWKKALIMKYRHWKEIFPY